MCNLIGYVDIKKHDHKYSHIAHLFTNDKNNNESDEQAKLRGVNRLLEKRKNKNMTDVKDIKPKKKGENTRQTNPNKDKIKIFEGKKWAKAIDQLTTRENRKCDQIFQAINRMMQPHP